MARTGLGFDSHRFAPDRPLRLGGATIDHPQGLAAHSDGDVVLHALTDAILGALAAGDIGEHFPDTDPRWANEPSETFLRHAAELTARADLAVSNVDITILAEQPKLSPHKSAIARSIAAMLAIEPSAVSVKAKTAEGMGFIGAGQGIAAWAAVLLEAAP
jgi:2-C-methyl-D-erythritol 2,4-cyclodiphosphate synthase